MDTFDQLEASLLYCPKCRQATPVRKRLLIVLPEGDKFDYLCTKCGTISGDKIERPPGAAATPSAALGSGAIAADAAPLGGFVSRISYLVDPDSLDLLTRCEIRVTRYEMRIASLLPSATEILCALGMTDRIVGVSHECDFPPEIVGRPVLTEPKLDPRGSSAEIDAAVRRLVRDGLSVYRIREDALRAARPDLIVTQEQCEVCAVSFGEVAEAVRTLLDAPAAIVSLKPNRLDDVIEDFARVAAAVGADGGGRAADRREPCASGAHPRPPAPRTQSPARRLHRVARAAHGGRQLDSRDGRARRRRLRPGRAPVRTARR